MTTHRLDLGTLDLASGLLHEDGYTLSVLADGASFGTSQAGVREIVSMLADGNLVTYDRAGNREATFDVLIEGADGVALQAGEVALRRELYKPNTVTWTPPADFSAPTVFEIVTSEMAPQFNDIDELRSHRVFRVTLTCKPFARSADEVTVAGMAPPPATPTTVTIDDGTSTSGWSATQNIMSGGSMVSAAVTPTTSLGAVVATTGPSAYGMTLTRTFPATSFEATRYLILEFAYAGADQFPSISITRSGPVSPDRVVETARVVFIRATFGDRMEVALDVGGTGVEAVRLSSVAEKGKGPREMTLVVEDMARSDALPQVTNRQITRIIEAGGTERTPASLHVASSDGVAPLRLAVVHTCPEDGSGYSPPLRRWRSAGQPATASTSLISGSYESITGTGTTYEIPTSAIPEGGYVLAARLARTASGTATVAWSASTIMPDGATQQGVVSGEESVVFPSGAVSGDDWHIIALTTLSLPSVRTKAGKVRITLTAPVTGGPTITIDEAWLFRLGDDCALSVVETDYPNVWLNSPGIDSPVPTVWAGNTVATRAHPGDGLQAMGTHVLMPEGTAVFTAGLAVTPVTDATFYRRWHSNAAS